MLTILDIQNLKKYVFVLGDPQVDDQIFEHTSYGFLHTDSILLSGSPVQTASENVISFVLPALIMLGLTFLLK